MQRHQARKYNHATCICDIGLLYGFRSLLSDELPLAWSLVTAFLGEDIASIETLRDMQLATETTFLGYFEGDRLTGVLASFLLNAEGVNAVESGAFNARNPARHLVCAPGEAAVACYGWVFAGQTTQARRAVVMLARALKHELCRSIPIFASAASDAGQRLLSFIGFERINCGDSDNLWRASVDPAVEVSDEVNAGASA